MNGKLIPEEKDVFHLYKGIKNLNEALQQNEKQICGVYPELKKIELFDAKVSVIK